MIRLKFSDLRQAIIANCSLNPTTVLWACLFIYLFIYQSSTFLNPAADHLISAFLLMALHFEESFLREIGFSLEQLILLKNELQL